MVQMKMGGKKEKYERKILHFHNKETIKQA